jgi:hypothetical protein
MYFRCVFADQGRVAPTRVMLVVGTEAVEGKDAFDTVKETYDQSVRWQWGAIDLGYLIMQVHIVCFACISKLMSSFLCASQKKFRSRL